MSLDLRKLEHLIAVAEEGSLTGAAARLHLSQQALSTSIRVLEREVGVPLLKRGGTGATVLPAGETLVEDARVLRGMAQSALRRARRTGRGEPETLRIGHTPAVHGEEVVELLAPLSERQPGPSPEVHQRYPGELIAALLANDLDVGLCRGLRAPHGLVRSTLCRQRLRLAVSADHPFAARPTVGLSELAGETLMVWGRPRQSGYTDLLLEHCRQAGFEPRVERTGRQGTPPVTAVVGTDRVAFVTAPPGPAAGGRAHVVTVEPAVHAPLHALYPPQVSCPGRDLLLHHFVRTAPAGQDPAADGSRDRFGPDAAPGQDCPEEGTASGAGSSKAGPDAENA